jgi:hypothetical protein
MYAKELMYTFLIQSKSGIARAVWSVQPSKKSLNFRIVAVAGKFRNRIWYSRENIYPMIVVMGSQLYFTRTGISQSSGRVLQRLL